MLSVCDTPLLALVYRHDSGEVTHDYDCCFCGIRKRVNRRVVCDAHLRPGAGCYMDVYVYNLSYREKSIQMWESCSMSL
jgi:hypothetical protein